MGHDPRRRAPARTFVDLVLGNLGSETDAWGVSRIPAFAAQAVAVYSDLSTRPELCGPLGARPAQPCSGRRARHRPPAHLRPCLRRRVRSDEAVAELEALLDGSLVLEGLAVDQDPALGAADGPGGPVAPTTRASTPSWPTTTPSPARRSPPPPAPRWAPRPPRSAPGPRPCATRRPQRDPAQHRLRLLAERARTTSSRRTSPATSTTSPAPGERLGATRRPWRWSTSSRACSPPRRPWRPSTPGSPPRPTVNPGALRYVREGRADVARALAAQAADA